MRSMLRFFVVATMVLATTSASAQYEQGKFSLQVRLAAQASTLTNMDDVTWSNISQEYTCEKEPLGDGFLGVDLEYQAIDWLGVSVGLYTSRQGQAWENLKYNYDGKKYKLKDIKLVGEYINVPLTANFYVWKGLALRTGVQLGFLTAANMNYTVEEKDGDVTTSTHTKQKIKDQYEKLDLSIPVGVSYEFKSHFVVDMRYNIGLTKVNKETVEYGEKNSRNGAFQLSFGYKFKL